MTLANVIPPIISDWSQRFGFGSPRSTSAIRLIIIHTTENAPSTPAENVATYQINSQSGSYHVLADRQKLLVENTDDWVAWQTGNKGNDVGLGLSFVARAAMTRAEWLQEEKIYGTITRAAWKVAEWSLTHGLPLAELTPADVRAGAKGITTHNVTRLAWGGTTHTDPGDGFPMDVLIREAKTFTAPPTQQKAIDMALTDDQAKKLDRIYHELTHRFQSRFDLDAHKRGEIAEADIFDDTLAGYVLENNRAGEINRRRIEELEKTVTELVASKE